ncbi:MAG TPA: BrnA antitoxin family protein [Allosphingosinicella sp.]|nr:BrnA antitoxin family protein [Allosphingosinicella sp.]
MSRGTIFRNISADSDEARQAALEGEVPELGPDFFKRGRIRIGKVVLRDAQGTLTRRGRPPHGSGPKVQQSLRLSPEVLDHFRATGPGWQARIDEVLRRHVKMAGDVTRQVAEAAAAKSAVAEERSPYEAENEGGGDSGA